MTNDQNVEDESIPEKRKNNIVDMIKMSAAAGVTYFAVPYIFRAIQTTVLVIGVAYISSLGFETLNCYIADSCIVNIL